MDETQLKRQAESKQTRIRRLMADWREHLAAQGRRYDRLDVSVYASWGGECVLRAIAAGPHGDHTVLKGGTAFRLWDGLSARPTTDLDLQAVNPDVPGAELRTWLLDKVCSEEFTEATGMVCRREDLQVTAIKDGILPGAWRIEGDVTLGPPLARSVSIHLCVEATWGVAPANAYGHLKAKPLLAKDDPFDMLVTKPEWMAAEKLHSLISRGVANTRLKDFFDLAYKLLPRPGLDAGLLRSCLVHVFDVEFKGRHAWPQDADGAAALTSTFATADKDRLWRDARWAELTGAQWEAGVSPTLGVTCEAVALHLERLGLLAPCPVTRASAAFGGLGVQGRACVALAELLSVPGVAPARLRDRLAAEDFAAGTPRRNPATVITGALEAATSAEGFAGVEAQAGRLGVASVSERVEALVAGMAGWTTPMLRPTPPPQPFRHEPVDAERLAEAPTMLAAGNLNIWMIGLATLCQARAAGQDVTGVQVPEPPTDRAKAARAWQSVARRNGFDADLDAVMAGFAAGPGLRA